MRENNIKFAVLGGDLRQLAVSRRLASLGFETAVWGLGVVADEIGDAVRCDTWEDAVKNSKVWILPLPASADGVYVNCSMCNSEEQKKLFEEFEETLNFWHDKVERENFKCGVKMGARIITSLKQ